MCTLCGSEEGSADHILFRCDQVEENLRQNVVTNYKAANNISEIEADFIQLDNTSRNKNFVESCINLVNSTNLKVTVELWYKDAAKIAQHCAGAGVGLKASTTHTTHTLEASSIAAQPPRW